MNAAVAAVRHVAAAPSGEAAKAGPIGLLIVLLLCVGCYFLFRSMTRHLKKVREEFPEQDPPQGAEPLTSDQQSSGDEQSSEGQQSSRDEQPSGDQQPAGRTEELSSHRDEPPTRSVRRDAAP